MKKYGLNGFISELLKGRFGLMHQICQELRSNLELLICFFVCLSELFISVYIYILING